MGSQVFTAFAHCPEMNMVVPAARVATCLLSMNVRIASVDTDLLSVTVPTASVSVRGAEADEDGAGWLVTR